MIRTCGGGGLREAFDAAVLKGLCAMVERLGRLRREPRAMVLGLPLKGRDGLGLTADEMRVMAQISRRQIEAGHPDSASEIFSLLACCTRPLSGWWPGVADSDPGLADLVLVDGETGLATEEALDIARDFGGLDAEHQQGAFHELMRELRRRPKVIADREYTALREFVIRHPVIERGALSDQLAALQLPSTVAAIVLRDMYEPAPLQWAGAAGLSTCAHCNNAVLQSRSGQRRCRTQSCHNGRPHSSGEALPGAEFMCVRSAFQLYWVEPGVDELVLFDAMVERGLKPRLYPDLDRVDIAIGKQIGIDLKNYSSPTLLGRKLASSLGGLSAYPEKWLVIPDRLLRRSSDYRFRLMEALGDTTRRLKVLSVTEAIERAGDAQPA